MDKKTFLPLVETGLTCTLGDHDFAQRVSDWAETTSHAIEVSDIDGGLRFTFDRSVDVTAMAALAAAEQTCCSFFEFRIGVTASDVTLDITGPEEARPLIDSFAHSG